MAYYSGGGMTMREILFRGKGIDDGKWYEGYLARPNPKVCRTLEMYDCLIGFQYSVVDGFVWVKVIPETVCQFTGLVDKHDKRIFEGDIVRYWDGEKAFTAQVVFECGAFGIARRPELPISFPHACNNDNFMSLWELIWNQEYLEPTCVDVLRVIGNVHDNPELLTNEKAGE